MRFAKSLALATALATALTAAATATAAPNPINTCAGGIKIESPRDGSYTVKGHTFTIDVNEAAKTFSYISSTAWPSVLVKGGMSAITYFAGQGQVAADGKSGSGLHAPFNARSKSYYGLSHICFFNSAKKK